MNRPLDLQDRFLQEAKQKSINVSLFLSSGFQLRGKVLGFDPYTVVLECEGKAHLVYKHAITMIVPSKPMTDLQQDGEEWNA